jgi:thiamine-monophosphate kinase
MNPFQMGRKSVIMNISDIIVKGVEPVNIIISLGIPGNVKLTDFNELIHGILNGCNSYDMNYIGGDLNQTQEIVINPIVFGFSSGKNIIHRHGMNTGDLLVSNGKFGLTGVGFDILLNRKKELKYTENYEQSIKSVLEPVIGIEAITLARESYATASIDSSDGLARSLRELMISNPKLGFELEINKHIVHQEAIRYSKEYDVSINKLIFDAGEEFNHLFTIPPEDFESAAEKVSQEGGVLYQIGEVISEPKIYLIEEDRKSIVKNWGYVHFGDHR